MRLSMRVIAALSIEIAIATASPAQTIRGPVTGTITDSTGAVLPGATITTINQRDGNGSSWSDAPQVKIGKRFSYGLQMLVAYTYSIPVLMRTRRRSARLSAERTTLAWRM